LQLSDFGALKAIRAGMVWHRVLTAEFPDLPPEIGFMKLGASCRFALPR
jgi:hypothetical protein